MRLLLLLGKTQISSMSCGLGYGAGGSASIGDWAAVLLQNRYNFVVIYSDARFQHVLQRLLHSYIKLHTLSGTHTHKYTYRYRHDTWGTRTSQICTLRHSHRIDATPSSVLACPFSVQFNFFYIFQFQVRCLSLLVCCCCSFFLGCFFFRSAPWRGLRTIEANRFFFWGSSIFAVFDSWCWSKQFNKPLEAIERVFLRFQIEEFDTKEKSVYRKFYTKNKCSWNEFMKSCANKNKFCS